MTLYSALALKMLARVQLNFLFVRSLLQENLYEACPNEREQGRVVRCVWLRIDPKFGSLDFRSILISDTTLHYNVNLRTLISAIGNNDMRF